MGKIWLCLLTPLLPPGYPRSRMFRRGTLTLTDHNFHSVKVSLFGFFLSISSRGGSCHRPTGFFSHRNALGTMKALGKSSLANVKRVSEREWRAAISQSSGTVPCLRSSGLARCLLLWYHRGV
ncbi:hypothetical protein B0J18DRAFT_225428 [Chaetomium sp. MPI-SDFR-AT-0129]|nr:hypothetical protein B0J18DRAFT_225428 [Chaetomium sp. MPI-SDFR-AT-0129]